MCPEPAPNVIEAEKLGFRIDGRSILDGLDFAVAEREIIGVIGASGSGKSTLIKCLSGLIVPSEGSLKIYGQQLMGKSERAVAQMRAATGYVFQYSALFDSMSVAANISLAPLRRKIWSKREARDKVSEKLKLVGLEGVEDYYPSQLSGGMAKRVGLARALALEPSIMFYDEPTSGLDPPTARSIDDLIAEMRDGLGLTSIVVSHDLSALSQFADRIALLENGRVALISSPDEFMASEHPLVRQFVLADRPGVSG